MTKETEEDEAEEEFDLLCFNCLVLYSSLSFLMMTEVGFGSDVSGLGSNSFFIIELGLGLVAVVVAIDFWEFFNGIPGSGFKSLSVLIGNSLG